MSDILNLRAMRKRELTRTREEKYRAAHDRRRSERVNRRSSSIDVPSTSSDQQQVSSLGNTAEASPAEEFLTDEESNEPTHEPNILEGNICLIKEENIPLEDSLSEEQVIGHDALERMLKTSMINFEDTEHIKPKPSTSMSQSREDIDIENEENLYELIRKVYRSLKAELNKVHKQLLDQKEEFNKLRRALKNLPLPRNQTEFIDTEGGDEEYNVDELPFTTQDDFDMFEYKLLNDAKYRMQTKTELKRSVDKRKTMTRNIGAIMRKYISQDIARNFTPVKRVEGRRVFKDLEFYKIIEDVMTTEFRVGTNLPSRAEIIQSMMSVLHNVKDWHGCRRSRKSQKN